MLLELAIGDAYGAGFEYAPLDLIRRHNTGQVYVKHPRHSIRPGRYTDDTQMSLAIAEAIVSGEEWTVENLARRFVDAFKRDPREGYSARFYGLLREVRDGTDLLLRIQPASDKSGAAMRAAPIGVFATPDEVLERCRVQAAITHDTPEGIGAAQAVALMTHYFLYRRGPKEELARYLREHVGPILRIPWRGKVGPKGWMSASAAVTAVVRNDRLSKLLCDCIDFTGDVDTVATMALAAASCCTEYAADLPELLVLTLENGRYGREYLVSLDQKLLALVPAR